MAMVDPTKVYKPELEYQTKAERDTFAALRRSGRLSFFRVGMCEICGNEVIKGKKFCSAECYRKRKGHRMNDEWTWDIDLEPLVGCHAHLETMDGIRREGRISAVRTKSLVIDGEEVTFPASFELNGDPMDEVDLDRLVRVDLVSGRQNTPQE
jgi:hypothetical protein